MKERPILMSTPMVQAILEGRKTMTRRTKGVEGLHEIPFKWGLDKRPYYKNGVWMYDLQTKVDDSRRFKLTCPYGQIGDRLWVKEKFWAYGRWIKIGNRKYFEYYGGEPNSKNVQYSERKPINQLSFSPDIFDWFKRPSLFLFRKSARILLEITNIRVERLQDISEEDAKAEGVSWEPFSYKHSFETLWNNINGKESWESNPYVWVIEFKVINK